ncbi:hypothetical protein GCM10010365_37720 [Streptomyces poonensis]|uniref:Secreted protein n=1 Tax=Streptomyces poonensis TaxID=68255 RepID=A0A918UJ94_9ACTN|nr:hypothetical protein GCM10010365_37720 [Streptomyces poonensis]GLJ93267.1 hypothetical protein GCM10017589_58790 [Streptomyces poonensis]
MHRLLPPSAIAGVSVVCALGPWLFSEPFLLRGLAAGAAVTTVVGAVVMRRWDTQAGKRVAELTRARASDEWRFEEQVAELESDLEESRELRHRLEEKLRAKRAELAGLRNEHAGLLRRYATAESERASALEGRRLLAIEASAPGTARALPAGAPVSEGAGPETAAVSAPDASDGPNAFRDEAGEAGEAGKAGEAGVADRSAERDADEPVEATAPGVFSPAGSALFLRANSALNRIGKNDTAKAADVAKAADAGGVTTDVCGATTDAGGVTTDADEAGSADDKGEAEPSEPSGAAEPSDEAVQTSGATEPSDEAVQTAGAAEPSEAVQSSGTAEPSGPTATASGDGFVGSEAVSEAVSEASAPALPDRSSGHFTVPTAVAVVPAAPRRRPAVEGGFDFFGTQKGSADTESVQDSVQNEDLADVVGEEALALHKAENEPEFRPADEEARSAGQVIDLTAHDETERIDLQGLRSAAS